MAELTDEHKRFLHTGQAAVPLPEAERARYRPCACPHGCKENCDEQGRCPTCWNNGKGCPILFHAASPSAQPAGSAPTEQAALTFEQARLEYTEFRRELREKVRIRHSAEEVEYMSKAMDWPEYVNVKAWQAARSAPANLDSVVEKYAREIHGGMFLIGGHSFQDIAVMIGKAIEEVGK